MLWYKRACMVDQSMPSFQPRLRAQVCVESKVKECRREILPLSPLTPLPPLSPLIPHLEPITAMIRRMQRRLRSLHTNRLTPLELVKLRMIHINRRRDITRLPHICIPGALRIIARQGIAPVKVERSSPRSIRAAWAVVQHRCFLLRARSAMGTHFTSRDTLFLVAEDVAGEEIDDSEDDDDDAARDDDLPKGGAERFLGRGLLVKVSEDGDAEDYH